MRNYRNTSDPKVRTDYAKVAGVYGIASNLILGALKLAVGLVSNSIGIMADAVNNISDCVSSCLTIVGFSLASKKPDSEHPYGHARYEYLFGFITGLFMLFMGVQFSVESFRKILEPEELTLSAVTFASLAFSVLVKFSQVILYGRFSRLIDSNALKASASDSRNDMLDTLGIMAALVIVAVFDINLDGLIGLLVSIFIIINSIKTIKEQISPLIGIKPTKEDVDRITERIMSYPGVLGIHDLVLHNYGVHNDFVTVHVEMDASRSFLESHAIVDRIETDFRDELGVNITIHMDPVVLDNPRLDRVREQVRSALGKFDPSISFHDMRLIEMPHVTKVVFDCVVPPEKGYTGEQISLYLRKEVRLDFPLSFVVEIDVPFS
ncbi:MAG: cation transporter [Spirochaetales bacterium]|nr:cation transporter [Spirochaetales bacterium]